MFNILSYWERCGIVRNKPKRKEKEKPDKESECFEREKKEMKCGFEKRIKLKKNKRYCNQKKIKNK